MVRKFASDKDLPEAARERLLREVHDIADQLAKRKEPISLNELCNRVWPSAPEELKTAFSSSNPPIPDGFVPRSRGLDSLKRFQVKTSSWRIEFYREAIQDRTIDFDDKEGTLTIKNLPADVIKKLQEEFYGHNASDEEANPIDETALA